MSFGTNSKFYPTRIGVWTPSDDVVIPSPSQMMLGPTKAAAATAAANLYFDAPFDWKFDESEIKVGDIIQNLQYGGAQYAACTTVKAVHPTHLEMDNAIIVAGEICAVYRNINNGCLLYYPWTPDKNDVLRVESVGGDVEFVANAMNLSSIIPLQVTKVLKTGTALTGSGYGYSLFN